MQEQQKQENKQNTIRNIQRFPQVYQQTHISQILVYQVSDYKIRKRKEIIKNLRDNQVQYIVDLKMIYLRIRLPLQVQLKVSQDQIQFMFGQISSIIQYHTNFVQDLDELIHNDMDDDISKIVMVFNTFFQFLIIYSKYISKISQIVIEFQKISMGNLERIYQMFKDFDKPVNYYIMRPFNHLLAYQIMFDDYLNNIQQQNANKKLIQVQKKKYKDILALKFNVKKKNTYDMKIFPRVFKDRKCQEIEAMNAQVVFECNVIYFEQKVKLYLIQCYDGYLIVLMKRTQFIQEVQCIIKSPIIEVVPLCMSLHYQNRIGVIKSDNFVQIKFVQQKQMNLLIQKWRLLQMSFINKNGQKMDDKKKRLDREFRIIELQDVRWNIIGSIVGIQNRRNGKKIDVRCVIKIFDYRLQIYQYVFIQYGVLDNLINLMFKNLNVKIEDQRNGIIQYWMGDKYELDQKRYINIENRLNRLLNNKQFRRNCEYFLNGLKIFQGFYKISFIGGKSEICQACNRVLVDLTILTIDQLVKLLEVNNGREDHLCSELWYNIVKRMKQFERQRQKQSKKMMVNEYSYVYWQKLRHYLIASGRIGRKLSTCYKFLMNSKLIQIKYFDVMGQQICITIVQVYKQQTVDILLKNIINKLELSYCQDFNLFSISKIDGFEIVQYDRHEYLENIDFDGKFKDFYFGKTQFYAPYVEQNLASTREYMYQSIYKRMRMIVGQLMWRVKRRNRLDLSQMFIKQYLGYIVEYLLAQQMLSMLQVIDVDYLCGFVNKNDVGKVKNVYQEVKNGLEIISKERLRQSSAVYYSFILHCSCVQQLYSVYESGEYVSNIRVSDKIQKILDIRLIIRYNIIRIVIDNDRQIIINYNEYDYNIFGNYLYFKRKIKKQNDMIWIRMADSFRVFNKIQRMERMWEERGKGYDSFQEL